MRSLVVSLLVVMIEAIGAAGVWAQQVAPCNSPPGGQVTCESHQAGFCDVKSSGRIEGACETLTKNLSFEEFVQWLMKRTGLPRSEVLDDSGQIRRRGGMGKGPGMSFALPDGVPRRSGGLPVPNAPLSLADEPNRQPSSVVRPEPAKAITCQACVNGRCETRDALSRNEAEASALGALCGMDRTCAGAVKVSCK